jgi:hypothetical protein
MCAESSNPILVQLRGTQPGKCVVVGGLLADATSRWWKYSLAGQISLKILSVRCFGCMKRELLRLMLAAVMKLPAVMQFCGSHSTSRRMCSLLSAHGVDLQCWTLTDALHCAVFTVIATSVACASLGVTTTMLLLTAT